MGVEVDGENVATELGVHVCISPGWRARTPRKEDHRIAYDRMHGQTPTKNVATCSSILQGVIYLGTRPRLQMLVNTNSR